MRTSSRQHRVFQPCAGFTLVETVVVIVLLSIVAGIAAVFIVHPVEGYRDLARRAALVESAESALRRMARDIRLALPNSVRRQNPASGFALELIPALDGAKYNTDLGGADYEKLTFKGDDLFDLLGTFPNAATLTTPGIRLVINNRGTAGNDVYADAGGGSGAEGVITSTATSIGITTSGVGNHRITLNPPYDFKGDSPNQRVYVVTVPVSYLCNTAAGTLTRYYNYPITATQPTTSADFTGLGATSALVADRVTACSVTTTTDEVRNRGLVTLSITLESEGERIRLIRQVALDNSR